MAVTQPHSTAHHVSPVLAGALGAIFLGLCLVGLTMELSTTEAYLTGRTVVDYTPHWDILGQLPMIFTGGLGSMQGPAFVAWVITFLYVAFSVVGKILDESIRTTGRIAAGILKFVVGVILLFDIYTTLNNGPTLVLGGFFGHLACLACILLCMLGFGTLGLRLLFDYTFTFLHGN